MRSTRVVLLAVLCLLMALPSVASAVSVAVWLDNSLSDGGNAIPSRIDTIFGAGSATIVNTVTLEGDLSAYDLIVVSRFDASFGSGLSVAAAANVAAYVGSGPTQGGVALFNWDVADNLSGSSSGDPFDANMDQLFVNAVTFAAATGHGYIGEFNGAAMAYASNSSGFAPIGLMPGSAGGLGGAPVFTFDLGPIGPGHAINAGVTYPILDTDATPFRTAVSGVPSGNIVATFRDIGLPAVVANAAVIDPGVVIPEPASLLIWSLLGALGVGIGWWRGKR